MGYFGMTGDWDNEREGYYREIKKLSDELESLKNRDCETCKYFNGDGKWCDNNIPCEGYLKYCSEWDKKIDNDKDKSYNGTM